MKQFSLNCGISLSAAICLLLTSLAASAAGGGADYGRGPETDPIATPILATATGNVATLQGQMTAVQNRTGTWNQAATDGSTATSAIPRIASMEGRTGVWNQAATDGSTATGAVGVLQGRTSVWDQAASSASSATGAVGVLQGRTSVWEQAASDASSATGSVGVLNGKTNGWDTAVSNASSATGSVAILNASVWGVPGITPSPALLVNTCAIQAKNIAGGSLTGYRVLHVWVSETNLGAASTNNIETLVLSTGTAVSTVTANADYWYVTAAAGTATAVVTGTAVGTNYLMVGDGSTVGSSAITFVP